MIVPKDYPRSARENYFLYAFALRRKELDEEARQTILDGIGAVAVSTASLLLQQRAKEFRAA